MIGNKKNNTAANNNAAAFKYHNNFGQGTVISGEVKSQGDVRVDGKIVGTVDTTAKLVVGGSGVIEGDVNCANASVEGKVMGQLNVSELLFLKKTAVIQGDIVTKKLVIEEGARFDGTCSMGGNAGANANQRPNQQNQRKNVLKKQIA